ncbi:MAG TPA: hypothetical protein VHK06_02390 [Candidatus Limnocylindria bacterium]|nr:hypothetical protein [Candidatus Limnocylindria bacterium]
MSRRILAIALLPAALLAACGGAGRPELSDPREIITQGLTALGELDSFRFELAVSGEVSPPETGGMTVSLDGTSVSGAVDVGGRRAGIEFAVPTLMGLSGEMRLVDEAMFVKTSLTGERWSRQPLEDEEALGAAADPAEAIATARDFLSREGVESRKLDDAECGPEDERTCYNVELEVPSEILAEAEGAAEMADAFPDGLDLTLLFDKETLHLREASTTVSSPDIGSLNVSLQLTDFDEAVSVEAPPADEVDEGGGGLPFP